MRILRYLLVALACLAITAPACAQGSNGGLLYASDFAQWTLPQGTGPASGTIAWSSAQVCQVSTTGGYSFTAPKVGRPLTIVDSGAPAHTETVTPTQVIVGPGGCTITAGMAYTHYSYSVKSGTAGLQEAVDYQSGLPQGSLVVLTPAWMLASGITSMITSAYGNTKVSIFDARTSVVVPYTWNGSAYVAGTFGGGGLTSFAAPSASWPSWLVPTVTNAATTPSLAVAAAYTPAPIPTYVGTAPSGACSPNGATEYLTTATPYTLYTCNTTWQQGSGGAVIANSLTINNSNAGAASGSTFDGSAPLTISANTVGAVSLTPTDSQYLTIPTATNFWFDAADQFPIIHLQDTKAAISSSNYSSPLLSLGGNYWDGSVSRSDAFAFQDYLASGNNPAATLTLSHGGSSGVASVNLQYPVSLATLTVTDSSCSGTGHYVKPDGTGCGTSGTLVRLPANSIVYSQSLTDPLLSVAPAVWTSGHTFVPAWQPSGSTIAPVPLDLATYLASPPAIGATAQQSGSFSSLGATSTLSLTNPTPATNADNYSSLGLSMKGQYWHAAGGFSLTDTWLLYPQLGNGSDPTSVLTFYNPALNTTPSVSIPYPTTLGLVTTPSGINLSGASSPLQANGSAGTAAQCLISAGAGATPTWGSCGSGGDTITSPNSTISVGGSSTNTTLDLVGAAGEIMAGATPALTYTPSLGKSGTAGTLALYPATGNFTTTLGSAATASNTVKFFAAVPTNLDLFYCAVLSTTCTLTDAGFAYNAIPASSLPSSIVYTGQANTFGAYLQDFSGATQVNLPVAAGYASLAQGEIGYDSTNLNWHAWANGADKLLLPAPTTGLTSGDAVGFLKSTNSWSLQDLGGAPALTNAANTFTKNQQATGLTLNTVANVAAPTGAATNSGQSVPASTTNEAALTCIDSSGANTTVGTASANVTTTGGSSYIVWSYTLPSGCTTGYIWMKNTGSFSYYSVASGSSFTQNAGATTYTAAASYPAGGAYPEANTTGLATIASIYVGSGACITYQYGDVSIQCGVLVADSGISTTYGMTNRVNGINAQVIPSTTGVQLVRNVADANPAVLSYQQSATSTGDIHDFNNSTGKVAYVTQAGNFSAQGYLLNGTAVTINRSDIPFGYVGTPGATALLGSFMPQNSETITVAAGCTNCEASTSTAPTGSADLYNINVCTAGQGTCSTKCVVNIAASTGAVTYTSCSSSFSVSGGGSINITAAGTPTGVNPVFTIAGTHN